VEFFSADFTIGQMVFEESLDIDHGVLQLSVLRFSDKGQMLTPEIFQSSRCDAEWDVE
jgi:hypothetical protein